MTTWIPAKLGTRRLPGFSAMAFVAWILLVPTAILADEFKIGGTGTPLGTMKLLDEAFRQTHPDLAPTGISNTGSTGGIKAVVAGAVDIGVSARPLKAGKVRRARSPWPMQKRRS